MQNYNVHVKSVEENWLTVEAESRQEAETQVLDRMQAGEIILDPVQNQTYFSINAKEN